MPTPHLSAAEQDYIKAIGTLRSEGGRATTHELAARLGVKPPSVAAMVKHLSADPAGPYVRHHPYRGVELTPRGEEVALEMVRHHRLIELFLFRLLGVPWDQVHEEADRLEHVISEELEERIAEKLGQPLRDPHGHPIPSRDGALPIGDDVPLSSLPVGANAVVARVPDHEPALLRYLQEVGLVPGVAVRVEAVAPFGGVLTLKLDTSTAAVGIEVAQLVLVRPAGALH